MLVDREESRVQRHGLRGHQLQDRLLKAKQKADDLLQPETILAEDLQYGVCDLQGIEWTKLPMVSREDFRTHRDATYVPYRNQRPRSHKIPGVSDHLN